MEIFKALNDFAAALTVPGIALILLFGLYKEWWVLGGPYRKAITRAEVAEAALKTTTEELVENKITLAATKAAQEARDAKPRRGAAG